MKYLKKIILIVFIIFCFYIIIKNLRTVNKYMEGMNVDVKVKILPKKESTTVEKKTVSSGNSKWKLLSKSTAKSISTDATTFNNQLKNLEVPFYLKRETIAPKRRCRRVCGRRRRCRGRRRRRRCRIRRFCRRRCSGGGVANSHKSIIYKRLKPLGNTDLWHLLHHTWKHNIGGNTMYGSNPDFKLYSNLNKAKKNKHPWPFCNGHDRGIGFPRDCGRKGGQWQSKIGHHRAARRMRGRTWKWYLLANKTKTKKVAKFTNKGAYTGALKQFRLYDDNNTLLSKTDFKDVEDVTDSKGRTKSNKERVAIDGGKKVLRKNGRNWYDRTNVDSYSTIWKFPVDIPGETTINRYEIDVGNDGMHTESHKVSLTGITEDGSRIKQKSNYGPTGWVKNRTFGNELLNKLILGIDLNGMASEPSQNNIGGN